jgi:DNA-binding SARP family transcriptional activator
MTTISRHTLTAGDVVRGLGALLLLAVLVAGLPAALLAVAGPPPLPSTVPSLDDLVGALARPDDGTLLVAALTWVGWIGWATLAVSIAVEIPAAARGFRAPRLPALGPQQRLAAGLVATAAVLFTGTASLAAASLPLPADATPTLTDAAPHDASPEPLDSAEHARSVVHIVEPGDTLWDIAEQHLGNGGRYPDLYEASKDTTQPGGRRLTDPDLIYPGWEITIPGDRSGSTPARAQPPDEPDRMDGPAPPSTQADLKEPTIHSRDGSAPESPTTSPNQVPSPATTEDTDVPRAHDLGEPADELNDADDEDTIPIDLCTVGGIGATLAGGLLFYLGVQRARQHRHRKPGHRIALPADETARMEDELRSIHDPSTVDHVNRALRTITARCAMTGTVPPQLRYARLIHGQLELHLAERGELPAPFLPTASPTLWILDPDGHILDVDEAADYAAPYPSLLTIGYDMDGGAVLVDLEHVGALTVLGGGDVKDEVIAAMAAELGTSLWSDDLRVTVAGAAPALAGVLDGDRIRVVDAAGPDLDDVLTEMSNRAAADRAAFVDVGVTGLSVARMAGVAEGAWATDVLLVGQQLTDDQRDRLAQLIQAEPRTATAAVTTVGPALTEWTVHLGTEEADAVIDPLGLAVTPQRLGPKDHARVLDLLTTTHAEPTSPPPSWHVDPDGEYELDGMRADYREELLTVPLTGNAPSSDAHQSGTGPGTNADPHGSSHAPLVAVLGPVEIQRAPELSEPTKRAQLTALAVFLAMNSGATRDAVDVAMWPGRRVSLATRNTAMAKLRSWLGSDPSGDDYLPRAAGDGYRLHPAVRSDWDLFTELLPNGPARTSTSSLIAALDLVRGQPFHGANPRRYVWAERIQQEMIAAIGDVADELARRALHAGDHRLALKAVLTGLAAEPGSEQLWRHRLRAHHAAGDWSALERAADQLTALADELGGELEDETLSVLHELLGPTASQQPSRRRGR